MEKVYSQTDGMISFFESLSLKYINRSLYVVNLEKKRYLEQSAYYKRNRHEFQSLTEKYGEPLRQSLIVRSSVRNVDDTVGLGLFAEEPIEEGGLIGPYYGVVQKASRCKPVLDKLGGFATDYAWTYPVRQRMGALEINARVRGNELRFVNHSFSPNCRMEHTLVDGEWILFLVAGKGIDRGTQLTVDYGEEYWSGGHRILSII